MTQPFDAEAAQQPGDDEVVDVDAVELDADTAPDSAAQAPAPEAPAAPAADTQVAELTEALQRERAQFANFRRRSEEEKSQSVALGRQIVVEKLLPILDDLDRAREHGDLEDGPLRAFSDKLDAILGGEQLTKFGAAGDPFDPEVHEAIQNDGSSAEPVVGQVFRSGYRLGDRVIRHAMVTVTDPAPAAE